MDGEACAPADSAAADLAVAAAGSAVADSVVAAGAKVGHCRSWGRSNTALENAYVVRSAEQKDSDRRPDDDFGTVRGDDHSDIV